MEAPTLSGPGATGALAAAAWATAAVLVATGLERSEGELTVRHAAA